MTIHSVDKVLTSETSPAGVGAPGDGGEGGRDEGHDFLSTSSHPSPTKVSSPSPSSINPSQKGVQQQMAKMQQRAPSKRQIKMRRRFSLDEEERRIEAEKQQQQQQQQRGKSNKGPPITSEEDDVLAEEEELDEEPPVDDKTVLKQQRRRRRSSRKTELGVNGETTSLESTGPSLSAIVSPPSPKKRSTPAMGCQKCGKKTGGKASFVTCAGCHVVYHTHCVIEGENEGKAGSPKGGKGTSAKKSPPKRGSAKFFQGWKCDSCHGGKEAVSRVSSKQASDVGVVNGDLLSTEEAAVIPPSASTSSPAPLRRGSWEMAAEDGEKTNPFSTEGAAKEDSVTDPPATSPVESAGVVPPLLRCNGVEGQFPGADPVTRETRETAGPAKQSLENQEPSPWTSSVLTATLESALGSSEATSFPAPSMTAGVQPRFDCDRCSKSFTNKAHVNRHVQSVHLKIHHQCEICQKKFTRKDRLTEHLKLAHSQPDGDPGGAGTTTPPAITPLSSASAPDSAVALSTPEPPNFSNCVDPG